MSKILPEPEPKGFNLSGGIPKNAGGLFNFPLNEAEQRALVMSKLGPAATRPAINPRIWKQQRRALRDRILMDSQDDLREALLDSSTGSIFTPLPK